MNYEELVRDAVQGRRAGHRGWVRTDCPLCEYREGTPDRKQSMGLRERDGYWHCFRCNARGYLDGEEYERDGEESAQQDPEDETVFTLPPEYEKIWCEPALSAESFLGARIYLRRRRVSRSTCEVVGVGACAAGRYAGRIIIPLYESGRLAGLAARSWYPAKNRKYLNETGMVRGLWNAEALCVETNAPVLLVEGPFDALPHYPHAVACLGKPSELQISHLVQHVRRPIVVCLDGDAHELGWSIAMRLKFDGVRASYVKLPPAVDPGDITTNVLMEMAASSLVTGL